MPVNYILPAQKADNYIIIVDYTAIFHYALIPFSPLTVMDFRLACGSKGRHLTDKQDKSSKTLHMHRKCLPRSNVLMPYSTISLQYVAQPLAPGEKSQNKSGKYLPCKDHFSAIFHFVSLNFGHKEYWFWATVISNTMCRISTFKYEKITIQSRLSKCMYVSVNLIILSPFLPLCSCDSVALVSAIFGAFFHLFPSLVRTLWDP